MQKSYHRQLASQLPLAESRIPCHSASYNLSRGVVEFSSTQLLPNALRFKYLNAQIAWSLVMCSPIINRRPYRQHLVPSSIATSVSPSISLRLPSGGQSHYPSSTTHLCLVVTPLTCATILMLPAHLVLTPHSRQLDLSPVWEEGATLFASHLMEAEDRREKGKKKKRRGRVHSPFSASSPSSHLPLRVFLTYRSPPRWLQEVPGRRRWVKQYVSIRRDSTRSISTASNFTSFVFPLRLIAASGTIPRLQRLFKKYFRDTSYTVRCPSRCQHTTDHTQEPCPLHVLLPSPSLVVLSLPPGKQLSR